MQPVAHVLHVQNRLAKPTGRPSPSETTRIYTRPSAEDRTRALDLLPVDK
jgi:hypothetical protein